MEQGRSPKESSNSGELKERSIKEGELGTPEECYRLPDKQLKANYLFAFSDESDKWQDFLLQSWIVAGIGLFLSCSMFLKTNAFWLKASKLQSKLIKHIRQAALKVT